MLGASSVGGGVFHPGLRFESLVADAHDESRSGTGAVQRHAFTRRVGFRYSIQVLLNSLPLLLIDILVLTATIAACRTVFMYFKFGIGLDVSEGLIPITTGFVLLNFVMGLYPGVRLSPVEELRRLILSVTCIFIMWAVGVAVLSGRFGVERSFLLVVYLACLVTLPICHNWTRSMLARYTKWGLPALVCGDDPSTVRLFHWLKENRHLGLRPLGVIADRTALEVGPEDNWYLGSWDAIPELAAKGGAFWAIVVPPESKPAALSSLIADHLYTIPHVHVVSELTGVPDLWNPQQIDGLTGIHLQQNLMLPLPRVTKRCMDLVLAIGVI